MISRLPKFSNFSPSSQGGALVTLRQMPDLAYSDMWRFVGAEKNCPAVAVSPERKVYTCVRPVISRSIHTSMAQVLGGLFSGHIPKWIEAEDAVIKALLTESAQYEEKRTKSRSFNESRLRSAASRVADVLKLSFATEVSAYIRYFTSRLTEPTLNLTWDRLSNNCQNFCKKIVINGGEFDTILPKAKPLDIADGLSPRYLVSFASEKFGSQYDSPRYHTTPSSAYFAEFHTGEDIIEYFDTWPSIPKEKLCARLLCWPCQNDTDCSIAQHMWQFPHETISLMQMHILRNRTSYNHNYQTMDPFENEPTLLTDEEWFRNRLSVLLGLDTCLGAAGALAASYQMLHEVLAEQDKKREWKQKPVKAVGMSIRHGTETDRVLNFTIENVQKSLLPKWIKRLSKGGKMERHLAKNTESE